MAIDRQGTGLVIVRICLGVFFVFSALNKLRWLIDSSILGSQLTVWAQTAAAGSISDLYLHRIAIPGVAILARLVPVGEFVCGLALVVGFWTPIFALLAFLLVVNYQLASGAILHVSFLASPSGLPVLGSALGLAMGGVRLRWSVRT